MTFRLLSSGGHWYRPNAPATPPSKPAWANVANPANIDYAAGSYGAYNSACLSNNAIQGVVCNMNWSGVETAQGTRNWTPLDNVLSAWKAAGKWVAIVCRYGSQKGGTGGDNGILPSWEVPRIDTINDVDTGFLVPNHFNTTFQTDWKAFVSALGTHLTGHANLDAVAYVRIGCGLGAEGFYLMDPTGPNWTTYRNQMITWAGTTSANFPNSWRSYQESMLGYYRSVIPSTVPVMFPIVNVVSSDTTDTGNFICYDVAKWAVDQAVASGANYGFAQDGLPQTAGSNGGYGSYANMGGILAYQQANQTPWRWQFQAEQGLTLTQVGQTISNGEYFGGRAIEWYEAADATNSANNSNFSTYQTWVTSTFG